MVLEFTGTLDGHKITLIVEGVLIITNFSRKLLPH